jgi:hypothetical protein
MAGHWRSNVPDCIDHLLALGLEAVHIVATTGVQQAPYEQHRRMRNWFSAPAFNVAFEPWVSYPAFLLSEYLRNEDPDLVVSLAEIDPREDGQMLAHKAVESWVLYQWWIGNPDHSDLTRARWDMFEIVRSFGGSFWSADRCQLILDTLGDLDNGLLDFAPLWSSFRNGKSLVGMHGQVYAQEDMDMMILSWRKRARIYLDGGRGYWSWDDQSKIEWLPQSFAH